MNMKDMNTKKILVTGGSGFLGSRLVERLSGLGYTVVAPSAQQCDLTRLEDCLKATKGVDLVIHTAGVVTSRAHQMDHPADILYANSVMTLQVLEAARQNNVAEVVLIGSMTGYPPSTVPYVENSLYSNQTPVISESLGFYGLSKWFTVPAGRAYAAQSKMSVRVVIFPNLYGPGDKFDHEIPPLVANLIKNMARAMRGAESTFNAGGKPGASLDLLYVDDAVDFVMRLLSEPATTRFDIFNAGSGQAYTIRMVCEQIARALKFAGKITWQDEKEAPPVMLNDERARSLGWKPHVGFADGIERTTSWFLTEYRPH